MTSRSRGKPPQDAGNQSKDDEPYRPRQDVIPPAGDKREAAVGGYMSRDAPDGGRALNSNELSVLTRLLAVDFPGVEELRLQLPHARVVGNCECGCATVHLLVDHASRRPRRLGVARLKWRAMCLMAPEPSSAALLSSPRTVTWRR
jgi:hypothetical protein